MEQPSDSESQADGSHRDPDTTGSPQREPLVAPDDQAERVLALERELKSTKAELERLRGRRSVRVALGAASMAKPLFRKKRRSKSDEPEVHRREAETTAKEIRDLRPDPGPTSGPLVSIVIPTRNGLEPLTVLFEGLKTNTAYRSFEVIIVDNGSTDESVALFEADWPFPVRVVRNEENASFSVACNQGVEAASGEHVLLLNNDVVPINEGWLGALVATLTGDPQVGAVGALLVYPESTRAASLTVQHSGIAFDIRNGELRPTNIGGDDPTLPVYLGTWEVPAATAACLLVPASLYREIGGFDEAYVYGTEDVDLCLTLREAGHSVLVNGDAAMFHQEFGTQRTVPQKAREATWLRNLLYFADKWGARIERSIKLSRLGPNGLRWTTEGSRTVGITLTDKRRSAGWGDWYTAHELGEAFEAAGWNVAYVEANRDERREPLRELDVLICLLDGFDPRSVPESTVKIAWVRNWTDRWLDRPWIADFDAILPSSGISASLIVDRVDSVPGLVPLATNPSRFEPKRPDPNISSDYVLTANLWGEDRSTVNMLEVKPQERFAIYGKGWERDPTVEEHWRGPADYDDLPNIYSSANLVLDDTASPTLPYGALNSRVFDALACGTLVLTDNRVGSAEVFDGLLPSFETGEELRLLLDRYLDDPAKREALAGTLRGLVLKHHTYAERVGQITALTRDSINAPRVALKIGVPDEAVAETWGDTHFARSFAKSLRRLGFHTTIDLLPDWDAMSCQNVDIVVHVRGLSRYTPKAGHVNVMWMISHPDDVTDEECEQYDLVLIASEPHAEQLRRRVDVPVHVLLQATDPDLFFADQPIADSPGHGLVFVGNSRKQERAGVLAAVESGLDIDVYGGDWEGLIPADTVRAEYVPNSEVAAVYSRARFVLADHWPDMAERGFISNRIFDAAASGALVVSDPVAGMEDLFGALVPTFSGADELRAIADDVDARPEHFASVRRQARDLVLRSHTFDDRATLFADLVRPLLATRPGTV